MGRGALLFLPLLLSALLVFWSIEVRAEPIFADVRVNGRLMDEAATFERAGGELVLETRALSRLGLVIPREAGPTVALSSIPGVHYSFDSARQSVAIEAEPDALIATRFSARPADEGRLDRPAWGALVDYAYYAVAARGRTTASGLIEARVFGPLGAARASFAAGGPNGSLRRLETAFVHDDPDRARTLKVGDFITSGPTWTRPVRAAGVSLATDFELRPTLITQPMPRIEGAAGTPSSVDVYFDNVRRYSAKADPGPFAIDQLPMMDGRGQVSLVVTDVLGRQSVQSFPFYASSSLLRPGLTAYAAEAGFLRRDFAGPDDRYVDGFASGALRRGLSERITFEARGSLSRRASNLGLGLVANAADQALLAAAFDASSSGGRIRPQFSVSIRRETLLYSLFVSVQAARAGYRDLASRVDAPTPRRAVQAGGSANTVVGAFSISYNYLKYKDYYNEVTGVGWSRGLGQVNVFASAFRTRGSSKATLFRLGLSIPFGGRGVASGAVQSGAGGERVLASAGVAAPEQPGWGWRAQAEAGGETVRRFEAEVRRVEPWGEATLGASQEGRRTAGRLYGSGSLVAMGGDVAFARRVGESFALVDAGAPDVEITVENQSIGRTDRAGRLFAPQLPPFAASRIAVAPDSVPLYQDIPPGAVRVRPPRDAGVMVRLPVVRSARALVRITVPDGTPAPLGAAVLFEGREAGAVGYDGLVYLDDYRPGGEIELETPSGPCAARAPDEQDTQAYRPLGPVVCRPRGGRPRDDDRRRDRERPGVRAELQR